MGARGDVGRSELERLETGMLWIGQMLEPGTLGIRPCDVHVEHLASLALKVFVR